MQHRQHRRRLWCHATPDGTRGTRPGRDTHGPARYGNAPCSDSNMNRNKGHPARENPTAIKCVWHVKCVWHKGASCVIKDTELAIELLVARQVCVAQRGIWPGASPAPGCGASPAPGCGASPAQDHEKIRTREVIEKRLWRQPSARLWRQGGTGRRTVMQHRTRRLLRQEVLVHGPKKLCKGQAKQPIL